MMVALETFSFAGGLCGKERDTVDEQASDYVVVLTRGTESLVDIWKQQAGTATFIACHEVTAAKLFGESLAALDEAVSYRRTGNRVMAVSFTGFGDAMLRHGLDELKMSRPDPASNDLLAELGFVAVELKKAIVKIGCGDLLGARDHLKAAAEHGCSVEREYYRRARTLRSSIPGNAE